MPKSAELDIIIYGASGFTGALVCEYLATHYRKGVKGAVAGRNGEKLKRMMAEVATTIGMPFEVPTIIAEAHDEAALRAMVKSTKCVLTTTGPYQLYGSTLVRLCAEEGTDYVDLSGEPGWMSETIAAHHTTAEKSGARIVHSCGFDSIPFDLGVLFLQEAAIAAWGKPASRVRGRVRGMNGGFSGGTAASLTATVAAVGKDPSLAAVLTNPFALAGGSGVPQPDDTVPYEDAQLNNAWVAPFIMAPINTKNVHRTNALLAHRYGKDFCYDEMMVCGTGDEGKAMADFLGQNNPLAGDDVPAPGEGPSRPEREAGNYDVLFIAEQDGQVLRASVAGDMDPGYGSTSKMISESALCLVRDCPHLKGGIYTPAAAMGAALTPRLIANAGLTFKLED